MAEIIVFLASVVIVTKGSDWLGRSGISFAKRFGLPNFIIGTTFVALATSLPELSIATIAGPVYRESLFGLGTVLGSTIFNLGLILGLLFLFSHNRPTLGYFSRTTNIFLILSFLLLVISWNSSFGGLVSFLLISLGTLFLFLEYVIGKRTQTIVGKLESRFESVIGFFSFTKEKEVYVEFFFGLFFLIFGSSFLVSSALSIANLFKINEFFLAFTLIAFATSLPELLTSFNAILNKKEDLALGTLVGSSVIDLSIGVGLATLFSETKIIYPSNILIFGTLLTLGAGCLLSIWKKFSLKAVGILLISFVFLFFIFFAINQQV